MPQRALTNIDLIKYAKMLKIRNFRGVFMRDELPRSGPRRTECAIVNLDNSKGVGTHWCSYIKRGNNVLYYDSFGLRPFPELMTYLKVAKVQYSHNKFQKFNTTNCGNLALQFIYNAQ